MHTHSGLTLPGHPTVSGDTPARQSTTRDSQQSQRGSRHPVSGITAGAILKHARVDSSHQRLSNTGCPPGLKHASPQGHRPQGLRRSGSWPERQAAARATQAPKTPGRTAAVNAYQLRWAPPLLTGRWGQAVTCLHCNVSKALNNEVCAQDAGASAEHLKLRRKG